MLTPPAGSVNGRRAAVPAAVDPYFGEFYYQSRLPGAAA